MAMTMIFTTLVAMKSPGPRVEKQKRKVIICKLDAN